MKWYKKQLDAIKKEKGIVLESEIRKDPQSFGDQTMKGNQSAHNSVVVRNQHRAKTDAK